MSYPSQPTEPGPYGQPQQPTQPGHYPVSAPSAPRRPQQQRVPLLVAVATAAAALLVGCVGGLVLGNVNPDQDQAAGETTAPATEASPTESPTPDRAASTTPAYQSTEPVTLTIPDDLVGQNAAVAQDRLERMGFTRIEFGSVDPDNTVVLLPSNWTVMSVEPEPGSEVLSDSLLVLRCTKQD
jgi:hypothetical protein